MVAAGQGPLFRAALWSSQLGCPESWSTLDVDELAQLYDSEITNNQVQHHRQDDSVENS